MSSTNVNQSTTSVIVNAGGGGGGYIGGGGGGGYIGGSYGGLQWPHTLLTSNGTYTGGWSSKPSANDLAVSIINLCKGDTFNASGVPIWIRDEIALTDHVAMHFTRWARIVAASDYGAVPMLDANGSISVHPAFCSRETFDAFGAWWDIYCARFEEKSLYSSYSSYPTMPYGEIPAVFVVKSDVPEDEFCKIYPVLLADIWYENEKWIFTDQRDAVMAKMLFA